MPCRPYKGHVAIDPMVAFLFKDYEQDQSVANAIGASQASVFNWRTGVHSPNLDAFVRLANYKGFDVVLKRRV